MITDTTVHAPKRALWIDLVVLLLLIAFVMALFAVGNQWERPLRQKVEIDLSPWALPRYTVYSLARGWIAYGFSIVFTLLYASWMYYDARAQRFLLPLLDILQSIPVLTFLPILVLTLVRIFPHSNVGLELACVLAIFTGQVWNMTFSYYDSLRAVPPDFYALGRLYRFDWWRRFWKIELPFGAQGLLYNSMVSMAGGWFFLNVSESIQLGKDNDYRLPGIGSYMSVAIEHDDIRAQVYAVIAMTVMVVAVDRLVWWPLVVWSRKFKLDDFSSGPAQTSKVALWIARSQVVQGISNFFNRVFKKMGTRPSEDTRKQQTAVQPRSTKSKVLYVIFVILMLGIVMVGAVNLTLLLRHVSVAQWKEIVGCAFITLGRVLAATILGLLWTVPVGVWIGLNPGLAKKLQPYIQFCASFPAPMIYPWVVALVLLVGGSLQWGAIFLILLGTQWYLLFNVAGAAAAIPNEIISAAEIMRLKGWRRWRKFLLPAIFPGLVTGLITAVGGAWNATIVAEYVPVREKIFEATGLGALISHASADGDFAKLAAAAIVMVILVVGINRTVWKRLQHYANERCRFGT